MSLFDPTLALYGFVVGLLVGLTGMGGGVIMTPLLILGLGLPATAAVGTDLAYSLVTKIAGSWQHWRQYTVDMELVRTLAIGSVPASVVAVALVAWLEHAAVSGLEASLARGMAARWSSRRRSSGGGRSPETRVRIIPSRTGAPRSSPSARWAGCSSASHPSAAAA